ncbi:MAG: hypothetical protein PVG33_11595, partial [Chloroflexota bacterium]
RSPAGLTVAVRNNYARKWLVSCLQDVVNRTVLAIAGRPIAIDFVTEHYPEEAPMMPEQANRKDNAPDRERAKEALPLAVLQTRRLDLFLAKAGIPPLFALELPPNVTLEDILLRGGQDPMTSQYTSTRIRIYSYVTQSTFLHVEDALGIGKLRLFAGVYQRGKGITANAHHFLDTADARVVLLALAQAEPDFAYQEYKGSANGGVDAISRVFSVKTKGGRVYVELKNGLGRLTHTGAIQPNGKPAAEITIPLETYDARRMAVEVLAYLRAWDTLRLAAHRESVSGLPPYLLSPPPLDILAAVPADDSTDSLIGELESRGLAGNSANETVAETALTADNETAALKQTEPNNEGSLDPGTPPNPLSQLLHYQDGALVAPTNEDERRAFLRYRESLGEDPGSLDALRTWYAQQARS